MINSAMCVQTSVNKTSVLKSWFSPKLYTGRRGNPCWMASLHKWIATRFAEAKRLTSRWHMHLDKGMN